MGAGSGGSTGRGPATRQWIAAALVLAAIPAGVTAGVIDSSEVAAWGLAGSALAAAVVLFAGSPTGGAAAPLWRLLALGVGLWGGALAAIASSYDEVTAVPIPSAADVPLLGGLFIVGVAAVLMALARTWRDDNIARIDAAIVGIGVGVVLTAFLWPELREEDLPRGGLLLAAASGVVACFLIAAAARLAITGASRLAAGRFTIEAVLGIAVGGVLLRTNQFALTGSGAGASRHRAQRRRLLGARPVRPCTRPRRGSASGSSVVRTTSAMPGSPCSRWPRPPDRSAPSSNTSRRARERARARWVHRGPARPHGRAAGAGRALEPGTGQARGDGPRCGWRDRLQPGRRRHPCRRDRGGPPARGRGHSLRGLDRRQRAWCDVPHRARGARSVRWIAPTRPWTRPCDTSQRIGERPVRLADGTGRGGARADPVPHQRARGSRGGSSRPRARRGRREPGHPGHPSGSRPGCPGAVRRAPREAERGALPAARPPQQRRGADPRARRPHPLPDAVGRPGAGLPRRRPRRRRLRPGAASRGRIPRVDLPRSAGPRRARDRSHRGCSAAAGRRLGDPCRDRRGAPPRQPGRGRDRAHHPRRHRSPDARGPAPPPGLPRCPHRPVEPGALPRPRRARSGSHPAHRLADPRGGLHRPRRLQAGERQPRPRCR